MKKYLFVFMGIFSAGAIQAQKKDTVLVSLIRKEVFDLSRVMMHDVVNPPAASRYYAYCMMGAYEIQSHLGKELVPLGKFVKSFPDQWKYGRVSRDESKMAAIYCILEVGKQMLPSGFMLEDDQKELIRQFKIRGYPKSSIDKAIKLAVSVTQDILKYSLDDNYRKLSTLLRYTPTHNEANWYPTPPTYMEAVEPHWAVIRPLMIDSAGSFKPLQFVPFSKDSSSAFYALAKEVYFAGMTSDTEHIMIANFWDCNPFAVATAGHMALGFKKISPGGHWMNIAGIASEKAGLDFSQALAVQTYAGIAIMDAFISCWEEKYRSNRIRPETYINRYVDPNWHPILQTPPFPEYTSGHSVISSTAAELLTFLLGEPFLYTDNSEIIFQIPPRTFHSFREAADEASISRLYGGIHYRDAIVNGQIQGKALADDIIAKMKAAGIKSFQKEN